MFSFLKKVVSMVLPWESDLPPVDTEEDEQAILDNIDCIDFEEQGILETVGSHERFLGQSDPVCYDVEVFKCTHKTGKVTHLCEEYGVIDNVLYFEPSQVTLSVKLKPNDEVLYSAYRVRENETERVYQVYALKNDPLEFENISGFENETSGIQNTEEITGLYRVITGRVTQRRGREVFVESADIWCNLDKVKASFIPLEGDWVELQAIVKLDEEAENLGGDVLQVMSLKPLLTKTGFGRITFWSDAKKEGAIENLIYFTSNSCEDGCVPSLGEEVVYEAVESDQEKFRWRAVKILCNFVRSDSKSSTKSEKNDSNKTNKSNLLCDKNGISIRPSVCTVEVELNEVKKVTLEVTNNGKDRQFLIRTNFLSSKNRQMKLVSPHKKQLYIEPKQTVVFDFECEGKLLGLVGEMFFFKFKNFVIAKRIEINVTGNKEMNKLLECRFGPIFKVSPGKQSVICNEEAEMVLYGPRVWTPPKFIAKERKCVFNIPKKLWNLAKADMDNLKRIEPLLQYAPYLKDDLNFAHYADRFHTLLYLEEIKLKLNFQTYNMKEVYLRRNDDFLVLEVPGLVEKRPSLIVGDKVILSQAWSEGNRTKHVGFVHDIREKEVFVKFHATFHEMYDESECEVSFEPNTTFFSKAHEAVNRAVRVFGKQWLFPSAVNEKPPQIDLVVSDQDKTLPGSVTSFFQQIPKNQKKECPPSLPSVTEVESTMKGVRVPASNPQKKTLTWANEMLNERQKLAVVSVLKGQGRPLPYIVFGPPGTGKTVTLVEMVIQIYRLVSESRILITTPSNSAADLISERLIDVAKFKPGELVRLMAFYRVHEGLVPEKLIPYSIYFSGREDPTKSGWERCNGNNLQGTRKVIELVGRHRITIATCSAIGTLHYKGLPPGHFTHILIDEAGQTSEPEVLISATFQNVDNAQIVLTGDPLQLGPVVFSNVAKRFGLGISLLQRLISRFPYLKDFDGFPQTSGFDPRFITKLNTNYRSVPEILSLPSQMFYNSDLIPTISQTDSEEATIIEKFNFRNQNRATPAAIIFHGIIGQNYQERDSPSWFNPHEIWQTIYYVRKLYSIGLKSSDIGIMTPYAKQVQKLKILLASLEISAPKIGSVEEFQGQERLVIIVSTVRSSPQYVNSDIAHSLGFVASPQRLNVVLTRARALLIIIGNPVLLSRDPYWLNVVKYCAKNNSYTGFEMDVSTGKVEGEGEGGGEEGRGKGTAARAAVDCFSADEEHFWSPSVRV